MSQFKRIHHQFSLFGFQAPKTKVPISKERILEAQALLLKGDQKGCAAKLRDLRYSLENYERRITYRPKSDSDAE